ncbi:MAG TPA: hypothetical protein RMH99_13525 [Sandaracinaceae bacterium LLY-WYZ-13_1]|nr:hypothetical protein [Sandaracinaceae bacterium LLY-WYZ-13_1]
MCRHVLGRCLAGLLATASLAGCGGPSGQVVLVVDTSLCEPGEGDPPDFDRVDVVVDGVDDPFCAVFEPPSGANAGCVQVSGGDFPLVLPVLSDSGSGEVRATVTLSNGGDPVACARATVAFQQEETRVRRLLVRRSCGSECAEPALEEVADLDALEPQACAPPPEVPTTPIRRIAAGDLHACLVDAADRIFCWGSNDRGQVGADISVEEQPVPVHVALRHGLAAQQVAGGGKHTCALATEGLVSTVWCWGAGGLGQLGFGETPDATDRPRIAIDDGNAAGVTAGPNHSCALLDSGAVRCWGRNQSGESTGTAGPLVERPEAVRLEDGGAPVEAIALAAGGSRADETGHTCARTSAGVFCWGADSREQLGRTEPGPAAALVDGLDGVTLTQLSAGTRDTCAVDDAGQILCWGDNSESTLGFEGPNPVPTPTPIDATTTVLEPTAPPSLLSGPLRATLASGDAFRCFIDENGRVLCFGSNGGGRLGSPTPPISLAPLAVPLPDGTRFVEVATGSNFACALPEDGSLPHCWGDNAVGQLGRAGGESAPAPIEVCD